jgi:hypothetical protein
MDEMRDLAKEAKPLEGTSLKRAHAALARLVAPQDFDVEAGEARLASLLETKAA